MEIIFDIFKYLLEGAENLKNFIFEGFEILGIQFTPIVLLGGGFFALFFINWLRKKLI